MPNKIYTGRKLFKINLYSYRKAILKIKKMIPDEPVVFISDGIVDMDSIRDLDNIAKADFKSFEYHVKKNFDTKIKPFT